MPSSMDSSLLSAKVLSSHAVEMVLANLYLIASGAYICIFLDASAPEYDTAKAPKPTCSSGTDAALSALARLRLETFPFHLSVFEMLAKHPLKRSPTPASAQNSRVPRAVS